MFLVLYDLHVGARGGGGGGDGEAPALFRITHEIPAQILIFARLFQLYINHLL